MVNWLVPVSVCGGEVSGTWGGAVPVAVGVGVAGQRCDGCCVAGWDLAVGFVGVCHRVVRLLGWGRSI